MNNGTPRNTTGTMSANVSYYNENFVANSKFAIVKYSDRFFLQACMAFEGVSQYIDFWIPANIPGDGSIIELSLAANGGNLASYSRFPDGVALRARSGTLLMKYDWQTKRMEGNFSFEIQNGSTIVQISDGTFDLTGIVDGVSNSSIHGVGTFTAYSDQLGSFEAQEVSIELKDRSHVGLPNYWQIIGRMEKPEFPHPQRSHIALQVVEHVETKIHTLGNNPDAWASYFQEPDVGIIPAVNGTLEFTTLPNTGHTEGRLDADFRTAENVLIHVSGIFDVKQAKR